VAEGVPAPEGGKFEVLRERPSSAAVSLTSRTITHDEGGMKLS
jgi:hypothetical protein